MRFTHHLLFYMAVVLLTKSQENCHCISQLTVDCDELGPAYERALTLSRNGCKAICTAPSAPFLGNGQQTAAAACVSAFAGVRQYREECWGDKFPFALEAVYQEFRTDCSLGCTTQMNDQLEECPAVECDDQTQKNIKEMFGLITKEYLSDEGTGGCLKTGCGGDELPSCKEQFAEINAFHEHCPSKIPDEMKFSFQSFKALVKKADSCDAHCSYKSAAADTITDKECATAINARWIPPSSSVDITLKFEKPALEVLTGKQPALTKIFADIHGVTAGQITGYAATAATGYQELVYTVSGVTVGYASYIRTLVASEGYLYDIIKNFKDEEAVSVKFYSEEKSKATPDADASGDPETEVVITFQVSKTSQEEVMSNMDQIEAAIAKAHDVERTQVSITNVRDKTDRDGNKTEDITEIMYSVSNDVEFGSGASGQEKGEEEIIKELTRIRDQASDKDFIDSLEDNIQHVECQTSSMCLDDTEVDHHDVTVIIIGDIIPRKETSPGSVLVVSKLLLALLFTAVW